MWSVATWLGFTHKAGRILFLGLDNAGKTTLLGVLTTGRVGAHRPTYNPNSEHVSIGAIEVTTIDLGGHLEARRLWQDYSCGVAGVVFVVDAAAPDRFPEVRKELQGLLCNAELDHVPFLVLGNKIDEVQAVDEATLIRSLDLTGVPTGKATSTGPPSSWLPWLLGKGKDTRRPLEVFMCTAVKGKGYGAGLRWLAQYL